MCDHHQLRRTVVNPGTSGDVDHTQALSNDIGALFQNDEYTDCEFVVEGQCFRGHKAILAARSAYFRAMLFGGMRESAEKKIELVDVNAAAFDLLLKYIYKAKLLLTEVREDTLLDLLGVAHAYGFCELETSISEYLRAVLNLRNACIVYDMASLYQLDTLLTTCREFLDKHANEILQSESIVHLSEAAFCNLLVRDSFYANEVDIFRSVQRWVNYRASENRLDAHQSPSSFTTDSETATPVPQITEANSAVSISPSDCEAALVNARDSIKQGPLSHRYQRLLGAIRLPLMTMSELLEIVRPSMLFSGDQLLDAIKAQHDRAALCYRGVLLANGENVASLRFGAQVQRGECRGSLLSGHVMSNANQHLNHTNAQAHAGGMETMHQYDMERGFTRHAIDAPEQCIVVRLGQPSIVNTVRMLLWDRDLRSYSYYVEVSIDDQEYHRVIDYRSYYCRSWQTLHFAPQVVRFVKVVGTHNTVNRVFHLVAFEAMYSASVDLVGDIVVPCVNVAHVSMSACVIEGVSRTRNALINGDTTHYDWDSGYTCHQLGHGSIVVQLAQPFVLSSMRLLLWDCDDRFYHYMIETSVDQKEWLLAADRRSIPCKSWQVVTFERRPVVFVRITGTFNSANEVFHAVHFEAPCDPTILQQYLTDQQNAMRIATHRQHGSTQPQPQPQSQPLLQPSPVPVLQASSGETNQVSSHIVPSTLVSQSDTLVRSASNASASTSVPVQQPETAASSTNSARQSGGFVFMMAASTNSFSSATQQYTTAVAAPIASDVNPPFCDASRFDLTWHGVDPDTVAVDDLGNGESNDELPNRSAPANQELSADT